MKIRFVILWSVLSLLLLTACAHASQTPDDNAPTLPSFSQQQAPEVQLQAALETTRNCVPRTVRYGTVRQVGEDTVEDNRTQTVTADTPFDRADMYAAAPYLPHRETFLTELCRLPLQAIPSNTGIIRFCLTDLTWEQAQALFYEAPPVAEWTEAVCSVALDRDAEGRLCRVEVVFETPEAVLTAFVTLQFTDSP